jgi:hypothetical protein
MTTREELADQLFKHLRGGPPRVPKSREEAGVMLLCALAGGTDEDVDRLMRERGLDPNPPAELTIDERIAKGVEEGIKKALAKKSDDA